MKVNKTQKDNKFDIKFEPVKRTDSNLDDSKFAVKIDAKENIIKEIEKLLGK